MKRTAEQKQNKIKKLKLNESWQEKNLSTLDLGFTQEQVDRIILQRFHR